MAPYKYLRGYLNKKVIFKYFTLSNLALTIGTVLLAYAFLFSATPPNTKRADETTSIKVMKLVLEDNAEIYGLVNLPSNATSRTIESFYPDSKGLKALGLQKKGEQTREYTLSLLNDDLPLPIKSLRVDGETIIHAEKNGVHYKFNGVVSVVLIGGKRVSARDISAEVFVTYFNDNGMQFLFIQGIAKSQILEIISLPAKKLLPVIIESIFENTIMGLIQTSKES